MTTVNRNNKQLHYNPDVLGALANLSSDEVFTPPEVANKVLDFLPQELFESRETTFLDPASKSGAFLREIAKRLIKGLEKEIPDLQERLNHIYQNQLFGIAITELTALLSRRTLYCSKEANGKYSVCTTFTDKDGKIRYERTEHEWVGGKCRHCGASKGEYSRDEEMETHAYEFIHKTPEKIINIFKPKNMRFDVIIGNPPYQLKDGGAQASAMPIYQKFVEQAKKLNPRYLTMIIPSRWFTGGKGLDEFRKEMLNDERLVELHDYLDAGEVFPGVEIKGGVCYFLWDNSDESKKDDKCRVVSYQGGKVISETRRKLKVGDEDIFIRYNEAISILDKVLKKGEKSFAEIVSSRKPFGLATNFTDFKNKEFKNSLKIYANKEVGFVSKNKIEKNKDWIAEYKVFIPKAVGSGKMAEDFIKPVFGEKNSVATETYVLVGPFDAQKKAKNVMSYIKTRFFHFLVGLLKNTQDATSKVYQFVPMQDFSDKSDIDWSKSPREIDQQLYKKYGLTKKEIDFIESMVREVD